MQQLQVQEQLVNSSIQQITEQYCSKKNTHISIRFMDDLLLNRLGDISIPVVWTIIITHFSQCSHAFMRGELSRYGDDEYDEYDDDEYEYDDDIADGDSDADAGDATDDDDDDDDDTNHDDNDV